VADRGEAVKKQQIKFPRELKQVRQSFICFDFVSITRETNERQKWAAGNERFGASGGVTPQKRQCENESL
jgi:hypothetical protein